jgi:hypothetical protein
MGSGGFPPRKEGSYEGPSGARPGGLGVFLPGNKAHTRARAERDQGGLGGFPQETRLILALPMLFGYAYEGPREASPRQTWDI